MQGRAKVNILSDTFSISDYIKESGVKKMLYFHGLKSICSPGPSGSSF